MRDAFRFAVGAGVGAAALGAYLLYAGPGDVLERATAVPTSALALVALLVVAEALADGIGVWASVRPLNGGVSLPSSARFALAGDFFDTLSPAGPVSSEPIMARFFSVATDTGYSEALGVRGVAKYAKSAAQLLVSTVIAGVLLLGGPVPRYVLTLLGGAALAVLLAGVLLVWGYGHLSQVLVAVLAPVVRRVSALFGEDPHGREAVSDAVERFWTRAFEFRDAPGLLGLVALGGVFEQLLTAAALAVALGGTGASVAFLPVLAVVPLPQAASVVPVPASLGAYDVLLAGAIVAVTGAPAAGAAAAVLVVRTLSLLLALGAGGVATASLRGWRP